MSQRVYRFGEFAVDTGAHALLKSGVRLSIQEQPLQVLLALVEAPGQVVTREALRTRLWGTDTFVDFDQSLNSAMRRLRIALEDNSREPFYVETIPRVGFRFLPEVIVEVAAPPRLAPIMDMPHPAAEIAPAVFEPPLREQVAQAKPNARRFGVMAGAVASLTFIFGVWLGMLPSHWRQRPAPETVAASERSEYAPPLDPGKMSSNRVSTTSLAGGGGSPDTAVMSELEGWYHLNQRTQADYVQAQADFGATLAKHPEDSSALVGLGQSEILIALNGDASMRRVRHARAVGQQALALSPHLAAAHSVIGAADALMDWNDAEAEQEFRTSLHLDPHDSLAHLWYAVFVLLPRRQYHEAEQEAMAAVREDPLSLIAHTDLGWILYTEGKRDAALEEYRFVLHLNPGFVPAQFRMQQIARAEAPPNTRNGNQKLARRPAKVVNAAMDTGAPTDAAQVCALANQVYTGTQSSLDALRAGVQQHCPTLYFFAQDPVLSRLKSNPAFVALVNAAHPAHPLE